MRLIKLKIRNIASLKGEHEIDFASIQNQSPLFAITGETGAGKSSILNSIGLVLYGKVYKSNVTQNDLVTLGEKEGQIELIFQVKGKSYLALWRAKVRKQNGEYYSTPQTPQREMYTLDGLEFSSPKTILTVKTEELLNLDFDQFCKCIILNQGEFARFLSSSFTERKEILEKLYPGEMLESLSRELKTELDGLQKQKNELDIELATLKGDGPQGDDLTQLKGNLEQEFKLHEGWFTKLESMEYHYSTLSSYHQKNIESQNKIDSVKEILSKETSIQNELLVASQKAAEELLVVQKSYDEQYPGLQELLKSEEALKHAEDQRIHNELSLTKLSESVKLLDEKLKVSSDKLTSWQTKSAELVSSIQFPLDEMILHYPKFDSLFETFNKAEMLDQELQTKEERLSQLEAEGKELNRELKELQTLKTSFEEDKKLLVSLEAKKKELSTLSDDKQRATIRSEELTLKSQEIKTTLSKAEAESVAYAQDLVNLQQEYFPLETTIKLQSLLSAVEVCLTHPSLEENKACPVCKTSLTENQIQSLKGSIEKTDFTKIKARETELSRLILKKESELAQNKISLEKAKEDLGQKTKEITSLSEILNKVIPSSEEIETELKLAQKKVWEQEKLLKDEERLNSTLGKTREQYAILKKDITLKSELKVRLKTEMDQIKAPMSFVTEINSQTLTLLKSEARKVAQHQENQSLGDKLKQERSYLEENLKESSASEQKVKEILKDLLEKITTLHSTLTAALKGKKASELISELSQAVKDKAEILSLKERELKAQELKLKESQSRLYTLDELIKDIDLQFTKELHTLKEFSKVSLPLLNDELKLLTEKLGSLSLELKSPSDLFVPLKNLIEAQKTFFKAKTAELNSSLGSVSARLEDWEKRQDRITLLLLKSQDLTQNLERRARLYEVLGKDELRTFVLSLVEENLITQTNDELQKLCQGRYEIVHQSRRMKLTPEFYILDKFREGGLRKVSTLSGGETFMVSLAMALGLAEMTRGTAEIDSLFIDEGFGTLDQDSLEDVLDMLKQIQTRGLMVGIISHVKVLTNALPVNLLVQKKQDGTSSVGIVYN